MKRLIAFVVAAFGLLPSVLAQDTVTGVVVDKKGNPLPGVKIEIPGTPDQTISDLDGTFTINRSDITKKKALATYAGMNSRKVRLKDGMRIKMSEANWWTSKPEEWNWFVDAVVAIPDVGEDDIFNPAYGLMVGRVKTFGYYIKGVTNTFSRSQEDADEYRGLFSKQKSTYWSASAGGIMRLGCPIHLYVGAGYVQYQHLLQGVGNDRWYYCDNWESVLVDFGVMLRFKRINISLGTAFAPAHVVFAGNFGIGYSF